MIHPDNYTNMNKMKKCPQRLLLSFVLTIFMFWLANAQPPMQMVISPEVHIDKTVTFRLWMPGAKDVKVDVEFEKERQPLVQTDSGIWSVTLGPVKPDIYPYSFIVDGIRIMDPANRLYFPNEHFKRSLVDITGDMPLIHSLQDVPHGNVSYRYYYSKTLNTSRQLVVYTPPGYEQCSDKKFPVLYLIHGMTDTEETWFKVGHANLILDNLIAQAKAVPMVIVMPYANIFPDLMPDTLIDRETRLQKDLFSSEMLDDVIPFIEKNCRILADKDHRAVAGFSLGGRQALAVGLANPDRFGWVCAYAPAIWTNELENNFRELYSSPDKLNQLQLLSISCGKDDRLYQSSLDLVATLTERKISHRTFFPGGGHTWMNCRLFLTESAQQLFR
jgi:enterochelin esterase-like enzyme